MGSVVLYRGTNRKSGQELLNGEITNRITWWSTNPAIIAHYYDGIGLKAVVKLNENIKQQYIADCDRLEGYTYGYMTPEYPKDSVWYSIGGNYLRDNLISLEEVFEWPDDEEDE